MPYETTVFENAAIGTTVLDRILITDRDAVGENLDVFCTTTTTKTIKKLEDDPCKIFNVTILESRQDRLKAAIILNRNLNYNENTLLIIPLYATDGIHNTSTNVIVRIEDVQNSPPIFQSSLATIINENSPIGTLVLTIQARDGDRGNPRKIVYDLISNPLDYFLIDPNSGELRTAKPLDKEELPDISGIINLIVRAREVVDNHPNNDASSSATTNIAITIRDVNDSPPTFNQKEYYLTIPENTAVGTPLPIEIIVNDPDVGQNSVFSLRLEDVSEVFEIEPKQVIGTSQISIRVGNGSLDYENVNQRKFIVLIVAEETLTNPKLSSTATLTVTLSDVNDNFPHFEHDIYTATVSETASEGQLITTITATDLDSSIFGDQGIRYSLNGTGAELFKVDSFTGVITVAKCPKLKLRKRREVNMTQSGEYDILHYEHESSKIFDNHSTLSLSTETTNDYITYHHGSSHFTSNVEHLHNYEYDDDVEKEDNNNETQKQQQLYMKNNLGKYPCLDYETQKEYYLNYQATDNKGKGQMSVVSLRISVVDANDSPPKCESNMYRATLDEGSKNFDGVGLIIKARDEDVMSDIDYR